MTTIAPPTTVTGSIAARRPFTAGDLHGGHYTQTQLRAGLLSQLNQDEDAATHFAEQAARYGGTLYVVWSSGIPIAWARPDGPLVVPLVAYGPAVTRHQLVCIRANNPSWPIRAHA